MLTCEEFKEEILRRVMEYFPDKTSVRITTITKNNGISYEGLAVLSGRKSVSVIVNISDLWQEYLAEKGDMEEITKKILELIIREDSEMDGIIYRFQLLKEAKENLYYALINYEQNRERLENIPHKRVLDLAVVLYVGLKSGNGYLSMQITENLLQLWETDFDSLYETAERNTMREQFVQITSMKEMLKGIFADCMEEERQTECATEKQEGEQPVSEIPGGSGLPVDIISNARHFYGAACMLSPGVLEKEAEKMDSDLFILPCSVHEIIVLPAEGEAEAGDLHRIVQEANAAWKDTTEWLSDSLYHYDRKSGEITVCRTAHEIPAHASGRNSPEERSRS